MTAFHFPHVTRAVRYACAAVVLVCGLSVGTHSRVAHAAPDAARSDIVAFESGEELIYDVTFLSIHLGTVRVKTDGQVTREGRPAWHGFCYADSREGIPFVSLHMVFESWIDEAGGYSYEFVGSDKTPEGDWKYSKYLFRYPEKTISVENGKGGQVWKKFDINTPLRWCDGLSLFFYARRNAMFKKNVSIPSIVQDDTARTLINFLGEQESQDIDAVNYHVDCNHFTGTANWTGVYGMTGKFEGWFSNDRASIPIKARIKLMVGSAWLELVKWNRQGWAPPRAN